MAAVLFSKTFCFIHKDVEWRDTERKEVDSFRCKHCVMLCKWMLEISLVSCSNDCCCDISCLIFNVTCNSNKILYCNTIFNMFRLWVLLTGTLKITRLKLQTIKHLFGVYYSNTCRPLLALTIIFFFTYWTSVFNLDFLKTYFYTDREANYLPTLCAIYQFLYPAPSFFQSSHCTRESALIDRQFAVATCCVRRHFKWENVFVSYPSET